MSGRRLLLGMVIACSLAAAPALELGSARAQSGGTTGPSGPTGPTGPSGTDFTFTSGFLCKNETGRCNRDVFTMDPAGGQPAKPVAPFPGVDDDPAISPNGQRIVFSSDRVCDPDGDGENTPGCQQNRDIYLINRDGTNLTRLTNDPHAEHRPRWSPFGDAIVFHREADGGQGNADIIYKFLDETPNPGEGESKLTTGDRDYQPVFSPSGHQVAFTRVTLPDDPATPITPNVVGANLFVYDFCGPEGEDPVVGPIGDKPGHPDFDQTPAWKPDPTALADPHNGCAWDWRTKGELAFASLRACGDTDEEVIGGLLGADVPGCSYELFKMPADTGEVVTPTGGPDRLTTDASCTSGPAGPGEVNCPQDLDPTYSPNGTHLAYWSDRPEPTQTRSGQTLSAAPLAAGQWARGGPMRPVLRALRRGRRKQRQAPPAESFQNAEDNDIYSMVIATRQRTILTPDGNKGTAEKYDDMAPNWGFRVSGGSAGGGGGGGGGGGAGGRTASVTVTKFHDANVNGVRDAGEGPIGGIRFFGDVDRDAVLDPGEPTAVTGADGRATLILSGTAPVRVTEVLPAGTQCTTPKPCRYDVLPGSATGPLLFGNARVAGAPGGVPVKPAACARNAGLSRVGVSPRSRGRLRLRFRRRAGRPVTVDVFQVSHGRRVFGPRRVARFAGKQRSFTWAARGVSSGYYFARFKLRGPRGTVLRRVTFKRVGRRFVRAPKHYWRARCRTVGLFALHRPVFGGRGGKALRFRYRLGAAARVRIVVRRGSRVVRRYAAVNRAGRRTYGGRLGAARRPRGLYRVVLRAKPPGRRAQRVTLFARRL